MKKSAVFLNTKAKRRLLTVVLVAAYIALFYIFDIGCVFRKFFGIVCPGCGMTRAAIAICRLDFEAAFKYNPLIYLMPLTILYIIKNGRLFKTKRADTITLLLLALSVVVFYILRLTNLGGYFYVL